MPAVTVGLVSLDCPDCGVIFAVTAEFLDRRKKDAGVYHCPNGHEVYFPDDEEKARDPDALIAENRDLKGKVARLTHELDQAQAKLEHETGGASDAKATQGDGATCPFCGKRYRRARCLPKHIRNYHRAEVGA